MPKIKIDYSNTIFYKICCKDVADLYIGHTTNFVQRKHSHKQGCTNIKSSTYNCRLYTFIRNNGGWDNWHMEIIAFHECHESFLSYITVILTIIKTKINPSSPTGGIQFFNTIIPFLVT